MSDSEQVVRCAIEGKTGFNRICGYTVPGNWELCNAGKDRYCEHKAVLIRVEVLDFLRGKGSLDGVYFGDHNPCRKGNFWWRRFLPRVKE